MNARDIRCLCHQCREDYIDAGYKIAILYPLQSGLCDKCERAGYDTELNPTKRKRGGKRHAKKRTPNA